MESRPGHHQKLQAQSLVFLFVFATISLMPTQDKIIQEIIHLLNQNFIFDSDFKSEVKRRIPELSARELTDVKAALLEAEKVQRESLADKIRNDKGFYERIIGQKRKFDAEILSVYEKKTAEHDRNRLSAVLTRLKHL